MTHGALIFFIRAIDLLHCDHLSDSLFSSCSAIVLALIVFLLIFFLVIRKKKSKDDDGPPFLFR